MKCQFLNIISGQKLINVHIMYLCYMMHTYEFNIRNNENDLSYTILIFEKKHEHFHRHKE